MASRLDRPRRAAGLRTLAGLPAAALASMVGVALVVNAHLFGWPGAAGGIALIAGGIALGVYCFRPRPTDTNPAAAAGRPDSGEHSP